MKDKCAKCGSGKYYDEWWMCAACFETIEIEKREKMEAELILCRAEVERLRVECEAYSNDAQRSIMRTGKLEAVLWQIRAVLTPIPGATEAETKAFNMARNVLKEGEDE